MTTGPSIYKNPEGKAKCMAVYDAVLAHWPVPYEHLDVPTRFGSTHIIVSGPKNAPPLILLPGNWATAMMWSSAISDLGRDHRAYAIDQIDDVGKSVPTHIPASRSDYANWLLDVFDQLELVQADIVGLLWRLSRCQLCFVFSWSSQASELALPWDSIVRSANQQVCYSRDANNIL